MLHTPCNSLGHLGHNLYLTVIGTIYLLLINWCPLFESLRTSALTDHSTYSQEEYLRSSTNTHTYYYVDSSIHIPPKTFFANWLRYPQIYLATFTSLYTHQQQSTQKTVALTLSCFGVRVFQVNAAALRIVPTIFNHRLDLYFW